MGFVRRLWESIPVSSFILRRSDHALQQATCSRLIPMKMSYKNNMPIARIGVKGPRGEREYDAYLDAGAGRTLIPKKRHS